MVYSFLKEVKPKNTTTSVRIFECASEKLEHCIRNITKIDGTVQETIVQASNSGDYCSFLAEYTYVH